jgi:tetratricopeptide (TPR) repeat protein/DNA-binding CsgD family transcriptional regulator
MVKKCSILLIFIASSSVFFFVCFPKKDSNQIINEKISNAERKAWSNVRRDTVITLKVCEALIEDFPNFDRAYVVAKLGIANLYKLKANYALANLYVNLAYRRAKEKGMARELAFCYLKMAEIGHFSNNTNEMLVQIQQAEKLIYPAFQSDFHLAVALFVAKGLYFRKIQKRQKAVAIFKEMMGLAKRKRLLFEEAQASFYLGWLYGEMEEYEKSLSFVNQSVRILEQHFPSEVADMYYEKAIILMALERYEHAFAAIEKSRMYFKKFHYFTSENKGILLNLEADVLKNKGRFVDANYLFEEAKLMIKQPVHLKFLYGSLFDFYEKKGDYKTALAFQRRYIEMKDSLFSTQHVLRANDFENKLRMAQQEHNFLAEQHHSRVLLIISIFIFIVTAVFFTYFLKVKSFKVEISLKEASLKAVEVELKERKLVTNTMYIAQQNELLNRIVAKLEDLDVTESTNDIKRGVKEVVKFISRNFQEEVTWNDFKLHFEAVSPDFFRILKRKSPKLTELDLKHCAYIKINLTQKQVANLLGISPKSVSLFRVRLKKKLELMESESLSDFLREIS